VVVGWGGVGGGWQLPSENKVGRRVGRFHIRIRLWSVSRVSVDPSVVGRDWSPVSSKKARGCCCQTPGGH
jgi:hypothetical protein